MLHPLIITLIAMVAIIIAMTMDPHTTTVGVAILNIPLHQEPLHPPTLVIARNNIIGVEFITQCQNVNIN